MKNKTLNQWHKEHNDLVRSFHKNHEMQIQLGENGESLLARWERFFYNKVIEPIKAIK